MNCENCDNELYEFDFLSLRKYERDGDDECLIESHGICSRDCADSLREGLNNTDDFRLYEVKRCVGYYDCERLDNLRGMCENKEEVGVSYPFGLRPTALIRQCEPAQVGIIKSSLKLLDLMDDFDKKSTDLNNKMLKHTKSMNWLTKLILIITGVNLSLHSAHLQLIFTKKCFFSGEIDT